MEDREFGILSCSCYKYPVIDGIPIILKRAVDVQAHVEGSVQVPGPSPAELISLILQYQGIEALLSLISFPWGSQPFMKVRLLRKLTQRNPIRSMSVRLRRMMLRKWVSNPPGSLTAQDWFSLFYLRSFIKGDHYNYFFLRLTQPRYIAALSLMTIFPQSDKPLLDLASGFGHLSHYLTKCEKDHQVVAVDRNFFQLWVGKHWIAPKAHNICADAEYPLPFKDNSLGGVVCSDAFHYFQKKIECLSELRRCAPDRTIILTRVGNQLVQPNEGAELSPESYMKLMNTSNCRLIGETELAELYLQGVGPKLMNPVNPESLNKEKWLSIVLSKDNTILRDHGKFETLPHSVGHLGLNPIYKRSRRLSGGQDLSFYFPSSWFAFENSMMQSYHPSTVSLDKEVCQQIRNNIRSESVNELISRFVVLGMPQRYTKNQLRI